MFSISVVVGRGQPVVWGLLFHKDVDAIAAFKMLQESVGEVTVTDDFGQTMAVKKADVSALLFEDMEKSRAAHIERTINEQKIKAAVVTRMQADPAFRSLAMAGPPILGNGIGR